MSAKSSLFLLGWLFTVLIVSVFPLPFAVVHARGRASDPMERTLPASAWERFMVHLRRRLRIWAVLWPLLVLSGIAGYYLVRQSSGHTPLGMMLWFTTMMAAIFMSIPLTAFGFTLILSEYTRNVWILLILALVLSVGGLLAVLFAAESLPRLGFPGSWFIGSIEYASPNGAARIVAQIQYAPYYYLVLAALFAFWSFRRARRRGDRWFRFQV